MARQGINTGSSPDAGDGDALLTGAIKINENFNEIYTTLGDGTNITNSIGFAVTAGIATYATTAGIATYSTTAGIASALISTASVNTTGIITASSFVGDGSGLTGVVGSGSGVVIKDDGSTVGTAGTIDFGNNLSVSAISAGIVTITASGGGGESYWISTAAGIHTLSNVGIGTTNPTSALTVVGSGASLSQLYVAGVSTLTTTDITGHVSLKATGGSSSLYVLDDNSVTFGNGNDLTIFHNSSDSISRIREDGGTLRIDANPIELQHSGNTKLQTLGAGVTVTGTTFTDQLVVSGVSTFTSNTRVGVDTSVGVILTSPNNTQYQLFVEDDGTLKTVAV